MMTLNIPVIFVAVFSLWNVADATVGESLEMRIFDRDSQVSDSQIRMMLEEAALEEHGFKLEVISKLMTETSTGSGKQVHQKAYFYYKIVDCSKVPEVSEELEYLMPGVFGSQIIAKIRGEIRTRNLNHLKKCQTGLEVHFKEMEGCYKTKKSRAARFAKDDLGDCGFCLGYCKTTKVLVGN